VVHFTFGSGYGAWRRWRTKPSGRRGRCGCIVEWVHFVPNTTTWEISSCPLLSTATYRKTVYSCLKTTIAVGAGQVRCALYKVVQILKIGKLHFLNPKLLNADRKVGGLTCHFGQRRVH
jgi:hypothetical protein